MDDPIRASSTVPKMDLVECSDKQSIEQNTRSTVINSVVLCCRPDFGCGMRPSNDVLGQDGIRLILGTGADLPWLASLGVSFFVLGLL